MLVSKAGALTQSGGLWEEATLSANPGPVTTGPSQDAQVDSLSSEALLATNGLGRGPLQGGFWQQLLGQPLRESRAIALTHFSGQAPFGPVKSLGNTINIQRGRAVGFSCRQGRERSRGHRRERCWIVPQSRALPFSVLGIPWQSQGDEALKKTGIGLAVMWNSAAPHTPGCP